MQNADRTSQVDDITAPSLEREGRIRGIRQAGSGVRAKSPHPGKLECGATPIKLNSF